MKNIFYKFTVLLAFVRGAISGNRRRQNSAESVFYYVRWNFIERMEWELVANSAKKANWNEWRPTKALLLSEIDHHYAKFKKALEEDNRIKLAEYSADCAVYFMKASEVYGEIAEPRNLNSGE